MSNKNLYVVTPIFNPWRYKSRINLYNDFKKYIEYSGAKLFTVEAKFNDRDYLVTNPNDSMNLQLSTKNELWHKERMINLGIQRLPSDWEYVAWIDADVIFTRPDWVKECVERLQHFSVLQMFSQCTDLSPTFDVIHTYDGIISAFYENKMYKNNFNRYDYYHPGFAWAATRNAIDKLGGLFDTALLGAADRHMALSLIQLNESLYPEGISDGYMENLDLWKNRAKEINQNVGYIPGNLMHYWHGKKSNRKYNERSQILIDHQYDPEFDLKFDSQGMYQYSGNKPLMQEDVRKYFQQRNEDSIDL